MDGISFSSDFPDFINEETLIKASLPPKQTHPHQFSEALPVINHKNNNNISNTPPKQKKQHQENASNKTQSNKNNDKGHHNQIQNDQTQNQESPLKGKLDPTKIVNRTEISHDSQHQQRQKQQRQKQQQQQQNHQHPQQNQQHQHQNQSSQNQHQNQSSQNQHQNQSNQNQHQNQSNQNQQGKQHGKKNQHKNDHFIYSYTPNQDNNDKGSPNKNKKGKKNKAEKNNNNNNNSNNNLPDTKKVEQAIDTIEEGKPIIFYSFNCYLSAAFNSESQYLYTYDSNTVSFNQGPLNQKDPITAFVLLDEGTYVYSKSSGIFVHSQIDGESFQSLPNITDIRPDYTTDKCHFFVLADGNLYICQYYNKNIHICLIHKNVIDFDFSKSYRIIVKKKGIRLYIRSDFKSFPVIKRDFKTPSTSRFFCDDDYIYEFSKGQVTPSLILLDTNSLKTCETIKNVTGVFSSDEVAIIINDNNVNTSNNNNNLTRMPRNLYKIQIKEQTYELKQLPTNVIINDGVISIWSEYDFPPIWLQIPDLQGKQNIFDSNFVKETAESAISVIKDLNKIYDGYTEKLNNMIKQTIPLIDKSFGKLRTQMDNLNSKMLKIEEIAMNTGSTPQMCLDLYQKDVDRAFRAAAHYSIKNLVVLCGNNRFNESINNNRISDETLVEIAEVFTDNLELMGSQIVPYFVNLLLYFDPENEIFKARIKPLTSTILSATIGLFPTVEPNDPNYMNFRRLAHIAMSLQNS